MYANIGGKIKVLAKVGAWVGIIVCIISGIGTIVTDAYGSAGLSVPIGVCTIIIGSLLFWISSFALYGFGELVEKASEIARNTAKGN